MPYLQKRKEIKQRDKSRHAKVSVHIWRRCEQFTFGEVVVFGENVKDQNDWDTFSPYFSDDGAQLMCQRKGFTHCDPRRGLMDERQTWQKPQRLSEPKNSWMELTEEHSAQEQTENKPNAFL